MAKKIIRALLIFIFTIPIGLLSFIHDGLRFLILRFICMELEMFRDSNDETYIKKTYNSAIEGFNLKAKEIRQIREAAGISDTN